MAGIGQVPNEQLDQSAPLAPVCKILEQMRANPKADWTIRDVKSLCSQIGMTCSSPTKGSHYKVTSEFMSGHQVVPFKRPIRTVYIRSLIDMADAHIAASLSKKGGDK